MLAAARIADGDVAREDLPDRIESCAGELTSVRFRARVEAIREIAGLR